MCPLHRKPAVSWTLIARHVSRDLGKDFFLCRHYERLLLYGCSFLVIARSVSDAAIWLRSFIQASTWIASSLTLLAMTESVNYIKVPHNDERGGGILEFSYKKHKKITGDTRWQKAF